MNILDRISKRAEQLNVMTPAREAVALWDLRKRGQWAETDFNAAMERLSEAVKQWEGK